MNIDAGVFAQAIVPPDKSQDDATGVYYTVIANHKKIRVR